MERTDTLSTHQDTRSVAPPARISIVTSGSYFANLCLRPLLESPAYDCQVFMAAGFHRQKGNRLVEALALLRTWGIRYFLYKTIMVLLPATLDRVGSRALVVSGTCRRRAIPVNRVRNMNSHECADAVSAFAPDLLVSVSCPYRIGRHLLSMPRVGCLNVHSSLLPTYAGVSTYIHVLANGERVTGVTVHEMTDQFDAGRVVCQREVDIGGRTSVFRLFHELCEAGASVLMTAVDRCMGAGEMVGDAQDLSKRTYFGKPTSADIRRLRRRGHRLIVAGDFAQLVREAMRRRNASACGRSIRRSGR